MKSLDELQKEFRYGNAQEFENVEIKYRNGITISGNVSMVTGNIPFLRVMINNLYVDFAQIKSAKLYYKNGDTETFE